MAGSQSQHTMYLNVVPGLLTGLSTLTAGLASINTQFQNITKSVVNDFSIVEGVITTATVLALQFTKNMVDSYASFEQGMKIVQVVSNQSAEGLDQLKQKANEFSVQYRMDIDQITEGLQTLGRAGLNSASEQAEVLENGLQTAKLEGRELNSVLQEIIQNTALLGGDLKSDQFGEQSKYVNDLLVATSMTAPITTHDISETLKYSGGIAAAAGANIESDEGKQILTDYMASIAAFAQKGVSGSIAGTALRAFFNKPATQDSSVVEGLSMVGLTPEDLWQEGGEKMKPVSDQIALIKKQMDELNISTMDQLQIWSKIVGGKMGQQMMKLDSDDIKELTKDIKSADNASNLANASMKTYEATTKEIGESWEAIQRNIGEHAVRALQPIVTVISWIAKALSNPNLGLPLWIGIAALIGRGLATIWKVIQSIKQDVMVFVDMLRGKVNAAQNEEIVKLKENIAELKEKHADELEIIALKKEELALQDQINSATGIQNTQKGAQIAWTAGQQASMTQSGLNAAKMNQLSGLMNAQLTSQNTAFLLEKSQYSALKTSLGASKTDMQLLVDWIRGGMKDIEITAETTLQDIIVQLKEAEAIAKQSTSSTREKTIATEEEIDIEFGDASAVRAKIAAMKEELGVNGQVLESLYTNTTANTQNAEATAASAGAAQEHAAILSENNAIVGTYTTNTQHLGMVLDESIVSLDKVTLVFDELAAASEAAAAAALEQANTEQMLVEKRLAQMQSLWTNTTYMGNAYSPYLANWYRTTPQIGSYAANAAEISYGTQLSVGQQNRNRMQSQAAMHEGKITNTLAQRAAEEQKILAEKRKESRAILIQAVENDRITTISTEMLETEMLRLETERRMLEMRIESMTAQAEINGYTGEEIAFINELKVEYAEKVNLMRNINAELARIYGLTADEVMETQQGVIIKGEENIVEEEILAEKEMEKQAQSAKLLQYIGGPFGAAMLGLTVGMELWMHYMQDTQKKIQEAVQQYEDALSEWQSAEDEYRQSLKEANPGATSEELDDIELETYGKMYDDLVDAMDNNADAWEEMASGVTEKLPQYEYDEETDTMKLVEESISSEEATQKELDKNTKALYSAIEALNSAMSKYSQQATDSWSGTDGMISSPARKKELMQENPLWALPLGFMSLFDGSLASTFEKWDYGWEYERDFILTNQQKSDDYMGSTEITGLLLEDFKDANGDYIEGLRTVMGQSVNDFAAILPTASQQLLSSIAEMSSQISAQGNIKLQMSMKNDKKTWQQLAKEIAKYETKNKKSVGAQDTGEKKLENLIKKLELTTGGGFDRTQILQAAYIQQMSDMLSVAKEQIVPVIQQNMQTAMQNLFANMDTKENVTGTGDSTYATYSTAQAIAAMVAQIAWATAGEALYNEAMLIDPNTADPDQKRLYDAAQKADNAQDFVKDIVGQSYEPEKDLGYYLTHGIIMNPIWSDDSDQAWTYGADLLLKGFGAGTYKSVYGMSPVAAQEKAEYWVDYYREQGSSTAEIYHTFAQNYMTDGFINQIISAYEAADLGSGTDDDTGTGSDSGSGSDSDSDTGNTKNRVDLVLCNKKEIPKLNVNLFKKEPSFTVLNKNFKVRDIKVNTQDKPKAILSSVKNAIIDVEKRTDPKIIQDEAGEYDPVAATEGNSTPSGNTSTKIDS